jgi:putative transcriptional regulator
MNQARAIDVAAIRRRLDMSQRDFAGTFGLSVGTLRHWEREPRLTFRASPGSAVPVY